MLSWFRRSRKGSGDTLSLHNGCCRHPTGAEVKTRGEPAGSCTMTNEEKDLLIVSREALKWTVWAEDR